GWLPVILLRPTICRCSRQLHLPKHINRQAQERFERLIEGMKQAQGITEQLKAENALEWTGCLNNIRACAREIVEKEIIFA
ncbi:TPA: TnpV protein, partial [Campylobacter jejuni]